VPKIRNDVDPSTLKDIAIAQTVVGGKTVYEG